MTLPVFVYLDPNPSPRNIFSELMASPVVTPSPPFQGEPETRLEAGGQPVEPWRRRRRSEVVLRLAAPPEVPRQGRRQGTTKDYPEIESVFVDSQHHQLIK